MLTRMIIGHAGLNHTLHIMGKHKNGKCESCREEETIEHVIMKCKRYEKQRRELKRKIEKKGLKFSSIKIMKSASGDQVIKYILEYVRTTGKRIQVKGFNE